jgi:hypothetical protein
VTRQRQLAGGRADPAAARLLANFERSLVIFEEDLERLLAECDAKQEH